MLIALLFFSILFGLSTVSAEDNQNLCLDSDSLDMSLNNEFNLDNLAIDDINQDILNDNDDSDIEDDNPNPIDGKTFEDIQSAIDDAEDNATIELDGVYTSTGNLIKINKTLTIIGLGEGATLDANSISRVFDLDSNCIILQNLKIINSNFTQIGPNQGAVSCLGDYISILNCTFINNICLVNQSYGGAIRWSGNYGNLSDSIFINNSASRGGAVQVVGSNYLIKNCDFINNFGFLQEGALFIGPNGIESVIENCNFINNSANGICGALRACSNNNRVLNCTFLNNHAGTEAGAILCCWEGNLFENCIFINNSATEGGAIFFKRTSNIVNKCVFINNSANDGGAIYNNASKSNNIVKYSIFDNNEVSGKASAYYGEGDYLMNNFYGSNFNADSDFIERNLIYNGSDYHFPASWVNIKAENIIYQYLNKNVSSSLKFISNEGNDLEDFIPEYELALSNED